MPNEAEIEIRLKTTGADKAVADLKKVEQAEKEVIDQREVRITDTSRPRVLSAEERDAASAQNQANRDARTGGASYGLALDPKQMAAEEEAAKKAVTAALREQEQAEQDLLDKKFAAEDAEKRLKDVQEARARVAKKGLEEEKTGLDSLTRAAKGYIAVQLLTQLQSSLRTMKDLSGATAETADAMDAGIEAVDMFSAGLQTFIMTGNPYLAVISLIGTGIKGVGTAYKEMEEQMDATAKAQAGMQDWLVDSATYHADLARSVKADKLAAAFKEEAGAIALIEGNLRRLNQVEEARDRLQKTQAKVSGASGGDLAVMGLTDEKEAQQRERAAKEAQIADLNKQLSLQQKVVENQDPNGKIADIDAAAEKLAALKTQVSEAVQDFAAWSEASNLDIQAAGTEAGESVKADAESGFKKVAEGAKEMLSNMATANGGELDQAGAAAKARVDEILADGKVTLEELKALKLAVDQARQSRQAADQTIQKYFQTLLTDATATNNTLKSLQGQIDNLMAAQANR
jgi:hypothetical protein